MSRPRRPQRNGKPEVLAGRKRSKPASFLDEALVPYLLLDLSGTIVDANPPAARLLGREQAHLQSLPLREFVCEADRERFDHHLAQCRGGREKASTELRLDVRGTPVVELISPSCIASRSRKLLLHMIIYERSTDGNGSPAPQAGAGEVQKLNRTLRALSESSQAMMRATDEAAYMHDVCRIVQQDCGHAMVWIGFAQDDERKSILPVAHAGFEEGYLETLSLTWADTDRGRGPTGTAVRTGQPVICRNMRTDPRFKPWREEAIRRGYAASIALPLVRDKKTFGALTIYSREPDPFSADEVRLLSELAGDLSYGLTALRLRTAHEVAERSLRDSEARYRALFDSMAEGFALHEIITDTQGQPCDYRFLEVNPSFERLTGLTRGELIGKRVLEVLPDNEPIWIKRYGKVALTGEPARFENYSAPLGRWYEVFAYRPAPMQFAVTFADITDRKRAEEERREVEARVRRKLESVLKPEGDLGVLDLGDMIDVPAFQNLMNDFYAVSHFPMSIVDMKGRVLVGVGWQDICTQFHRVNPETCKLCLESDTQLSAGVARGEFRQYKCKNNLWDIATPIIVAGRQVGNVLSGQFFFDNETVDRETFRAQARQYRFDEDQYLAALDRVPRLSRRTVEDGMAFLLKLADMLSQLGYSNAQLARLLAERDRLAASLHEEKERLQRAQEVAHLGSWELDVASGTVTWSDEAYRIFGLEPQQTVVTYAFFLDHVHPDDRAAVDAAYTRSVRENLDSYDIEHRVINVSTGEIRFVHERCHHIRDDSGKIIRSVGMVHDITERKQADEALRNSEERLHLALKAGRAGAWDWNMATGASAISDSYRELFGIPPGQPFSYDSWLALVHPEDRERCRAYGEAFFGSKDSLEWDLEFRINTPHLGIRWHHATGKLQRDETGEPQRFVGVSTDVTDRKLIEESEERLKALMNHNPSLVFLKDESGRYVYLNDAYEEQFVHTKDWFGKTDFDFWPKESAELFQANDAEVLKSGRTRQVLEDSTDLEGKRHCWLAYKFPFTDSKGNQYLGGIGIDAIDRVRAEEAMREQQRRLTLAMEAGQLVPYEIDLVTGEVMTSPQLFTAFGLQPTPEIHHRTQWRSLIHEDDREGITASVEQSSKTGKEHHSEYRFYHSDGTIHWHETHGMVLADEQGRRCRLVGFLRDITERKRAEEAVAAAHMQLRSIIENTPAIVYALDLEERFVMANTALAEVLNCTPEQMIGKRRHEFMPREDADWHEANDRKVIEAGKALEFEEHSQLNGRSITWLTSKFPLHDAHGRIYAIGGISTDVSERKQAEEALRQSQKTLAELVESSPFGTYVVDSQFRVAMMNASSQENAFRNVRPLIGRDFSEAMRILWPEAVAAEIIGHFRHTLETGEPYSSPRFISPRHDVATVESYEWELHRMTLPDGQYGVICYYYDSTKLREAEDALRESEERLQEALRASRSFAFEWVHATDHVHRSLSCAPLLGLDVSEAQNDTSQSFFQRIHPGDRERFVATLRALKPGADQYRTKYRFLRPDGGITILEEDARAFFDTDDRFVRLIGVSTDVTARERAEQALKESEERFRLAIQHSKLMAWQCDTAMRFTWVYNSAFGIPDDDMPGKTPADLENETGLAEFIAHGAEVLRQGKGVRKTISYVRTDGQEKYFDQQIELVTDPDGKTVGLIGISLDVTERVLAEQQLQKSEESFRLMIGHSGEPILLVDQSGVIDCISRKAAGQLGYHESDLVGTSIDRFLDWSGKLDLTMRLEDFQRHAPSPAKGVLRVRHKDGSWLWLDIQASFVNYGQRPEKYLLKFEIINTDISR